MEWHIQAAQCIKMTEPQSQEHAKVSNSLIFLCTSPTNTLLAHPTMSKLNSTHTAESQIHKLTKLSKQHTYIAPLEEFRKNKCNCQKQFESKFYSQLHIQQKQHNIPEWLLV
jgi:hypothetical protein